MNVRKSNKFLIFPLIISLLFFSRYLISPQEWGVSVCVGGCALLASQAPALSAYQIIKSSPVPKEQMSEDKGQE